MERIVIEVSSNVARVWRKMPASEKRQFTNEISVRIAKKKLKESREEYLAFIDQLQKTMKEQGLTQEKLDEILNEED